MIFLTPRPPFFGGFVFYKKSKGAEIVKKGKILAVAVCLVLPDAVFAAKNCCGGASVPVGSNPTYDSSCTSSVSGSLMDNKGCCAEYRTTTTSNGMITVKTCSEKATYNSATNTVSAQCTCVTTSECDVGYYQISSLRLECTRCPSDGGTYGTTGGTGATSAAECYIPSGTAFSDSGGRGAYNSNCYYSI